MAGHLKENLMSIFGNIFGRIFGKPPAETTTADAGAAQAAQGGVAAQAAANAAAPVAAAAPQTVDIEAVLNDMAAKNPQKLNWRTSIVDLMKLVGMESSLQERKELADELGYTGDKADSAKMNMWLHKEVMRRMAANGGKVPANLLD
jgi:3-oxoacyl-ACP reductase-like protein